ncbi:N-acetyllactosaminide beta-1,3-N-acetylglucosaminyltransferase 2 [Triplophysa tibetana]|uniref:Hexosyltransferase n=1 Tax=Triplophysa tibetana TaxID=1572043 RepID=A0A5A9NL87_9TELE|nr:N-acetyllactosaminide beta-1,3-N-acetylglucosaminyltransferase 2 [Triplophysa tibetana]
MCMPSHLCRYHRRIMLICSPCFVLIPMYIYVSLAVTYTMKHGTSMFSHLPLLPTRFIATGLNFSKDLAPRPEKVFWRTELDSGAVWNFIQHIEDRRNNPILKPALIGASVNHSSIPNDTERSLWRSSGSCSTDNEILNIMPDYETFSTQMKDFVMSMHCRDYPMILGPRDVCDHGPHAKTRAPMLLLAIKSQSANFENREAIRQTWGRSGRVKGWEKEGGRVRRVFLLGTAKDSHTENKLKFESKIFGDIIQWNFTDTFFNLTLKDVLFWEWFSRRCPHARFIFKGDDDVFVRTPAILDYLQGEEEKTGTTTKRSTQSNMKQFVVGDVIRNAAPLRGKETKYYVPKSFYEGLYPTYPGGGGVVYSGSLAHKLFEVSQRVHLFPIDDVYLGMCLERLGVLPINHPAFLTFGFPEDEPKDPCAIHTILLVHKRSPTDMFQLWTETSTPSPECRNTTLRVKPRVP